MHHSVITTRRLQPPQQDFSGGLAPLLIDKVITRRDANVPDYYLEWAENFAVLNDTAIAHFARCVPLLPLPDLLLRGWGAASHRADCYHRTLGDGQLWLDKYDHGWVIELQYFSKPYTEKRGRVLAYLDEFPVLCPTLTSAAQLAEECFPDPQWSLFWHHYR
jgi:hypothetical protein